VSLHIVKDVEISHTAKQIEEIKFHQIQAVFMLGNTVNGIVSPQSMQFEQHY
jgi:hypothetical protein